MRKIILILSVLTCLLSCRNGEQGPVKVGDGVKAPAGYTKEIESINTLADTAAVNKQIRKGNALVKRSPDSAILEYRQALSLCRYIDYPEGRVMAYNNLTCCYQMKKDFGKANHYLAQLNVALQDIPGPYYNKLRHKKLLGQKYSYKAADLYQAGKYDSASILYIKTVEALSPPDSNTYSTLAWAYLGLGAVSGRSSNPLRALSYFDQAERLAEQYTDTSLRITVLSNKATLLMGEKKYDQAKTAAYIALDLSRKTDDLDTRASLANNVAICLINEQKPLEALYYSKMVMETALARQSEKDVVLAHYILGYNYVQLKEYRTAEKYLKSGLQMALAQKNIDNIANAYEQLAAANEGLGNYKEALRYSRMYIAIRDSLLGHESAGRIAEVETRYRVTQKDNELARKDKVLLENQLKIAGQQKRQYLWIGGALLCILTLLGLLLHKQYKAKLSQLKATLAGEEKERRRLGRELHDGIVSRLSIIKMNFSALPLQYRDLDEAADFQEVVDQLEQSITELRTTSHNLLPEVLQKAGLCESVNLYCEKIRKLALLDIEFQMLGVLPPLTDDFQLNVYRIIQELVNNILKHSNASHTLIQFQAKENRLSITIDDNGSGIPADTPEHNGIGMKSLNDRVQLLDGTMEIEQGRGTSVYLEFNIRKFIRKK